MNTRSLARPSALVLALAGLLVGCESTTEPGDDDSGNSSTESALDLAQDGAVSGFVAGIGSVPTMGQELAQVEAAMQSGDVSGAQTELAEVRTLLDNALASAQGTERVLLVALDLVVDFMEGALQSASTTSS